MLPLPIDGRSSLDESIRIRGHSFPDQPKMCSRRKSTGTTIGTLKWKKIVPVLGSMGWPRTHLAMKKATESGCSIQTDSMHYWVCQIFEIEKIKKNSTIIKCQFCSIQAIKLRSIDPLPIFATKSKYKYIATCHFCHCLAILYIVCICMTHDIQSTPENDRPRMKSNETGNLILGADSFLTNF